VTDLTGTVVGVYATVHTDVGDLTTEPPSHIEIDCELMILSLPVTATRDAVMHSQTLHFGAVIVTTEFHPPIALRAGDRVEIKQPLAWSGLQAGGPMPSWHEVPA